MSQSPSKQITTFNALDIMEEDNDIAPSLMAYTSNNSSKTYIVTGGSGFLGSHIVEHLLHDNHNVIVLDCKYPTNDILLQIEQAKSSKFVLCDITRYNDVYRAFNILKKNEDSDSNDSHHSSSSNHSYSDNQIECVFHCAALTDPWAPPSLYENVNIHGTQNIIRACQEGSISKLVYTSSTSVVLDGTDCQNGDESMKYVSKKNHLNAYSFSKHKSEEKVIQANNSQCLADSVVLKTCALRPHCIFGPRDTHFISQIISKARHGKITHMIGEGHNITDFTYIDNVVYAHLLAAKCLNGSADNGNKDSTKRSAAGQVYFITNGEPTLFWSFLANILKQLGCPAPTKYVSYNVAYAIALIMEFIYMVFGWMFGWKPILTRQMVCMMACHHWFSHAKATRDLGYKPIVTLDQGIKKTVQWIQWNRRRRIDRDGRLSNSDSTESLRSLRSDISGHSSQHLNLQQQHNGMSHRHINLKNIHYQTQTYDVNGNSKNNHNDDTTALD